MNVACPICHRTFNIEEKDFVRCPSCEQEIDPIQLLTVSVDPDATIAADPAQFAPRLSPGDNLAQFRLLKVLGSGGFGTVYEAFDSRLERHVALKVPLRAAMDQEQAKAFIKEARAAAKLRHPNIVSVFEVGRDGKHIFIVSELIKGTTLREKIKLESLDEQQSTQLMKTIAEAMHNAHQTGIAHRDLKPGNILLDEQGDPHVADFGLAKLISSEDATQTEIGAVLGTPAYMSPEQASGNSTYADSRTDIYAMGVIYYEMLTGKKPYVSSSTTILEEIQAGEAPRVREVAPHVSHDAAAICEKAMAVAPIDRYQTADALAKDISALLKGDPVEARPLGKLQSLSRWTIRRRTVIATTAAILPLGFLLISYTSNFWKEEVPKVYPSPTDQIEFRTVRIKIPGNDSQLLVFGIDDKTRMLAKRSLGVEKLSDDEFQFEAKPGFYLLRSKIGSRVDEFFRVVPTAKRATTVHTNSRITRYDTIDNIVQIHPFIRVSSDAPNFRMHRMISVPGGVFKGGSYLRRVMGNATEYRFDPRREHPIGAFEIGITEVTAAQYRKVMGRYPPGMALKRDAVVDDRLPVTHVSWLDAVEYCELTGTRLPTFLEYRYLATNFGQTDFPSKAAESLEKWPQPRTKVPADEVNSIGVYNLYSSVGEWAWDINLQGEFRQIEVANPDGSWRYERIVYGIPITSFRTPEIYRRESDGTDCLIDRPFHSIDERLGFRVVRPK